VARGSFIRGYLHFFGPGVYGCSSQFDQSVLAALVDVPELLGWLCACAAGGVVEPLLSVLRSRCIHEHPAKLAATTQASNTFLILSSHIVD
jgi:hypothetical protein